MEERQYVKVETIDGEFLCVQSFDCFEGDLIDVYDDDIYIGYIHGNLEYFTEDELIENIEDMIESLNWYLNGDSSKFQFEWGQSGKNTTDGMAYVFD